MDEEKIREKDAAKKTERYDSWSGTVLNTRGTASSESEEMSPESASASDRLRELTDIYFEEHGLLDRAIHHFRIKKNKYILDSFTDDGTKARMIERFGSTDRLLRDRPCAYDDMGNLVDLTGTGRENEYDAEVMISPDGQLSMI